MPIYLLYAGQVSILWGTKAEEKCDKPDKETGKAKENQAVQKVTPLLFFRIVYKVLSLGVKSPIISLGHKAPTFRIIFFTPFLFHLGTLRSIGFPR